MSAQIVRTASPAATARLGECLGRVLAGGDFVALSGPLGAGKTQFAKGLAVGLDVPEDEPVVSPTFVLIREYAGRARLYHVDSYRLASGADLAALGLEEFAGRSDAVVVVEWADRVADVIPASAVHVEVAHVAADERDFQITWDDHVRLTRWLSSWRAAGG